MDRTVVVVGAGAAGLTAALRAAEGGAAVTLLNAHPRIGLKILMSGGTRCNVTHREVTERDYFGGSKHVVARILRAFTPDETRAWFEGMGVALKLETTGKYFPETDDANTVLEALLAAARAAGVTVEAGARAVRLERRDAGGYRLGVQTVKTSAQFDEAPRAYRATRWPLPAAEPDRWIESRAVILASGGLSFPRTGSDGTGYALAESLGHTLTPPVPALTPLASDDAIGRALQGVTLDAELALWVGSERRFATSGSFLFTHFGYSGPAALDLSRHWLRAEGEGVRRVTANWTGERAEQVTERLVDAARNAPQRTVRRHLQGQLPERLMEYLCAEIGLEPATTVAQVSRERRLALVEALVARDLRVNGTLGYEKAEVTAGGVVLSEVNPSTLESRLAPGLYLCGEILDVDGRLGGFNFQWSWSSGTLAGRSVAGTRGGVSEVE